MTERKPHTLSPDHPFPGEIDIIDAHHHFLSLSRFPFHWLAPGTGPGRFGSKSRLRKDYLTEQYLEDFSRFPLTGSVHVQANCGATDPAAETRWLQAMHDETGWPSAIVGEADLLDPDFERLMRRHLENPALRGIRTPVAWDSGNRWRIAPRPGVMADDRFRRGLSILETNGLTLDIVIVPEQFGELAELANAHPDLPVVINHFGTLEPDEAGNAQAWQAGIDLLSTLPNVYMKLSGLWTVDRDWEPSVLQPYVDHLLQSIGPERILYGSNLPIESVNCSLTRQMTQLSRILATCPSAELRNIFSDTAKRVYRLD